MSAHTPGPWGWADRSDDYTAQIWVERAEDGEAIAEVLVDCDTKGRPSRKAVKEAYANARLIAAAPRMLALIKGMTEERMPYDDEVVEARAILHDVEGESHG